MADSPVFDWICTALARATSFSDIEARGTVRIALEKGGMTANEVSASQLQVVVKRVLPEELRRRGCDDSQGICDGLAIQLKDQRFESSAETPEDVFTRLGRA